MKTKLVSILIPALFISLPTWGQEKTVPSKVSQATVFFNGAELTHTASAVLTRGENQITIEGLSSRIDRNSLKVKTSNGVVVSASEYSIDYLTSAKAAAPGIQLLKDSIDWYRAELEKAEISYNVNQNMLGYLASGTEKNVSGSEQGLGIDDLIKTIEYYRTKAQELETEQVRLAKHKTKQMEAIQRLEAQLRQESIAGSRTSGILKLSLSAPMAGKTDFTVTCFTPAANWSPYYDVHIASTDKPIAFHMKSRVRQTTGLDWENVRLTLSTATPSNGKIAPIFSSWFLRPIIPFSMRNVDASEDGTLLEEVVVVAYGTTRGREVTRAAQAPIAAEPTYRVNGQTVPASVANSIDPSMIQRKEVSNGTVSITLKGMQDFVKAEESDLNVVYAIDLPYSIPGNGKIQNIDLLTKETPAEYNYYCAPKLAPETFILAEIGDWQKLGLLSGPANITYDGTYIGETRIDAASTDGKLTLTLGTEPRLAVKREKLQDFSSTRTLGSNTEQTFTYQITVKNNHTRLVNMVLKEQYPISTNKDITVTLLRNNTTSWSRNEEETGVITWEDELSAGESRTYRISYSVKYPKGQDLNL